MRCTCLSLLILLAFGVPARGDDLGTVYRGMAVDGVEIEGLDSSLARRIKGGLALTERHGFLGLQRISYEPGLLGEDIDRVRLFLTRHGYPYARVSSELFPNEKSGKIKVLLNVDPGPAVHVGKLEFVNVEQARALTAKEERWLGIAIGDVFTDRSAERARQAVLNYLLEQGYAMADVNLDVESLDSTNVAVRFTGDPGRKWMFGEVRIDGVPESFEGVVDRAANIRPGDPYRPRTVRDATDDIRGLRLFRRVKVSLVPVDSTTLDFVCDLSERQHRSVEAGIGYMTDDGLLVTSSWEHRNLFKGGRGFKILGSATQYKQFIESSVRFPALFRSPTTGVGSVAYERKVEPAYDATDLRTSFFLTYRYSRRGYISAGPLLQLIDVVETASDPDIPEDIRDADGPVTSLVVDWAYDNSNDPLFPTRGLRLVWDHQVTPPGLGSVAYFYRMGTGIAGYQHLVGSTVLAGRLHSGIGWPLQDSEDLLINYRYFAGGSNSHRGYQRERLGPKDAANNAQGGELAVLGSLEMRFPLWKAFEGALFLDAGQVWFRKEYASLKDISFAVGPGLSIKSPIGPIRFDYGIRVNPPDDGEPNQVFHFAIGYAF